MVSGRYSGGGAVFIKDNGSWHLSEISGSFFMLCFTSVGYNGGAAFVMTPYSFLLARNCGSGTHSGGGGFICVKYHTWPCELNIEANCLCNCSVPISEENEGGNFWIGGSLGPIFKTTNCSSSY
jgi:hypothetical protein